jgi:hypothetical protein
MHHGWQSDLSNRLAGGVGQRLSKRRACGNAAAWLTARGALAIIW